MFVLAHFVEEEGKWVVACTAMVTGSVSHKSLNI